MNYYLNSNFFKTSDKMLSKILFLQISKKIRNTPFLIKKKINYLIISDTKFFEIHVIRLIP